MTAKPAPPPVHVDEAETIRLLVDSDSDRPCAVQHPTPCERSAEWGYECHVCGSFAQFCTGHRELIDRQAAHGTKYSCDRDRTHLVPVPIPWFDL